MTREKNGKKVTCSGLSFSKFHSPSLRGKDAPAAVHFFDHEVVPIRHLVDHLFRSVRLLEQLSERQIHADNRLDRFEQALVASTQATQKNIDRMSEQIGFLLTALQGHIAQSTPPAHQD